MTLGGIHDHLGGGFHRYSTESTWSIPHFEKMLYDNAQLLSIYTQAYEVTGNPLYRVTAQDITAYLLEQMAAPGGGFYAAQDAEVDGVEGASYLWSQGEIAALLGPEAAERFLQVYSLTPMPVQSDDRLVSGDEQGVLRLHVDPKAPRPADEIVALITSQAEVRAKLLAARNARPQPARDEKIIVAWNALAIDALVRSGTILGDRASIEAAKQAAARLWALAYDPKSGELKHEIFRDTAQVPGYLDDYAQLGVAFLGLYAITSDRVWRDKAEALAASMLERFAKGGTLVTTVATGELLVALADDGDSTTPSGSAAALELLARLHEVTRKPQYARSARQVLAALSGSLDQSPGVWSSAVATVNRHPLPAEETAASPPRRASSARRRGPLSTADVVHARGEAHRIGEQEAITVTVSVDKGYHINANPATFDYLVPTALSIEGVADLRIDYPAATLIKPRFAPDGLKVYEGSVKLKGAAPSLPQGKRIVAAVKVQACDDQTCLPPATLAIRVQRK